MGEVLLPDRGTFWVSSLTLAETPPTVELANLEGTGERKAAWCRLPVMRLRTLTTWQMCPGLSCLQNPRFGAKQLEIDEHR